MTFAKYTRFDKIFEYKIKEYYFIRIDYKYTLIIDKSPKKLSIKALIK